MMGGTWKLAPQSARRTKPGAKTLDDLDLYFTTTRPSVGLVAHRVSSIEQATATQSITTSRDGSINVEQDPEEATEVEAAPLDNGTSVEQEATGNGDPEVPSATEQAVGKEKGLEEIIRPVFHANDDDEHNGAIHESNELSSTAKKERQIEEAATRVAQNRDAIDAINKQWPREVDEKIINNIWTKDTISNGLDVRADDSRYVEKQHSPRKVSDVYKYINDRDSRYLTTSQYVEKQRSPQEVYNYINDRDTRYSTTEDDTSEKSTIFSQPPTESRGKMRNATGKPLPFFTKRYVNRKNLPVDMDQLMEMVEKFDFSLTDSQMILHQTPESSATAFPSSRTSLFFLSTLGSSREDVLIDKDEDFIQQHWLFKAHKTDLERIEDSTLSWPSESDLSRSNCTTGSIRAPEGNSSGIVQLEGDTFPEGGLRAWLVVVGGWCGMFAALGFAGTLGAFQTYFLENQLSGQTPSSVAWIFSTYTFLVFGCGVYIGPLFDVYGPKWLLLAGTVVLVLMMFLLPYCKNYWQLFLVFGVLGGVGSSLIFTPCVTAPGHWFDRRRGLATGIVSAGGACGGIFFPLIMQALVYSIGFTWTTRIMEIVMVVLLATANLLIRTRLPRTTKPPHPDFRILANPAFSATVIGVFLLELGIFIPLTYITSYARSSGYGSAFAFQILPIINLGSAFGRWLPGFFSDRIGRYNTSIIFIVVTIFSIFACWLPFGERMPGLIVFALLFGFSSGSNISLTPVCISQLCDTRDYGRYYATCYALVSIGCLIGTPIAGLILESTGYQYWSLIVWTGCCYIYALVALIVARGLGGGWRFSKIF